MQDPAQQRLVRMLAGHSSRLEDLTLEVRRLGPGLLTAELLDELAVTVDELLLTLDEHRRVQGHDEHVEGLISDARALTQGMRALSLPRESVADAASGVAQGLLVVIRDGKRAA
jgi:hypothetical protein